MLGPVLVVIVTLLSIAYLQIESRKKFKGIHSQPPEPWGIPILGTLLRLGRQPYKTLLAWKPKFGPIIRVRLGSLKCVVINDVKLIKEALNSHAFSGRPHMRFSADRSGGVEKGILFTEGNHWKEQRRFILRSLKDFGYGTKSMEAKIHDEVSALIESLKNNVVGKPTNLGNAFNISVVNSLWSILVGERLELNDPDLLEAVVKLTTSIQQDHVGTSLSILIPWISYYFPKLSGYDALVKNLMCIIDFIEKQIRKHNAISNDIHKDQHQPPRDVLDSFTSVSKTTTDPNSSFFEKENVVVFTFTDLFSAGLETTSTTLHWLLIYMVHFPQIQDKLHLEIDTVLGKENQNLNRLPSLSYRTKMPFTEAVIHETLRFSTILPFALFHKTMEDTVFHNYWIPKGTTVAPNVYAVHFDNDIWGDPYNFRPERFLDLEGKFKRNENLLAFSTGKRVCLGEGLARDQLFLFTSGLFQHFKVCGEKTPDLDPIVGTVLSPKPFDFILKIRD